MVYRIHFTSQDLARTRVAEAPMPLSELQLAIRTVQSGGQSAWLDGWRQRVLPRLPQHARMVLSLIPTTGWAPTFLSPARAGTPQELFERVRATPSTTVSAQLAYIAHQQALPAWAGHLGDDAQLRGHLYDGLECLYAQLLSPYWQRLATCFTADRAVRTRHLLAGGVERLLTLANPRWMRWDPPVLEVQTVTDLDRDLYLEGQGILLTPSLFATRSVVTMPCPSDADATCRPQPTVTYPVGQTRPLDRLTALVPEQVPDSMAALAALLGTTRAAVLNAIAEHPGCTTRELARLAGTTSPGASQHAAVLRQAGLVLTTRYRNTALHSTTPLGIALLNSPNGMPQS
ncbi:winged helix-turn-helix domain-containing protein [Streptosporangium sp. NPDC000396]|uniref:winged helix-turn-helix domain-containing protein n=1 Tax=Streptosporangium sp. NPDC000396 TaxID=3366185 RepID=UPI0036A499F3